MGRNECDRDELDLHIKEYGNKLTDIILAPTKFNKGGDGVVLLTFKKFSIMVNFAIMSTRKISKVLFSWEES